MTIYRGSDDKLQKTLEGLNVPVQRFFISDRAAPCYITYQHAYSAPAAYSDDEPRCEVHTYEVDIYASEGHIALLRQVHAALYAAGFEDVRVNGERYEAELAVYHVPLTCKYTEILEE